VSGIFVPKNYQNLIIGVQVTVENVGDAFWDSVGGRRNKKEEGEMEVGDNILIRARQWTPKLLIVVCLMCVLIFTCVREMAAPLC